MIMRGEEARPAAARGECYELWSERRTDRFYAVSIVNGEVTGGCCLSEATALRRRHTLPSDAFDPTLGARLAAHRSEFIVVEEW